MRVQILLDFVSPYSYLGWARIHAVVAPFGRDVEPVPVLFAGMLDRLGQLGPAEIPTKRDYVFRNVLRLARDLGAPLKAPAAHPFNSLLALRVCSADMSAESKRRLFDSLFAAAWAESRRIWEPSVVEECLKDAGLDALAVLEWAGSPVGKEKVRQATEAALAAGAFGVPTMMVDGELFWGVDSLPHLEKHLAGKDQIDLEQVERWRTLPAQAKRSMVKERGT